MAYRALSPFLTLGDNRRILKFWFSVIIIYYEKLGHTLKPLVPKFRPEMSVRLKEIIEKRVTAKLKPIVDNGNTSFYPSQSQTENLASFLQAQGGTPPTLAETCHAWQFDLNRKKT